MNRDRLIDYLMRHKWEQSNKGEMGEHGAKKFQNIYKNPCSDHLMTKSIVSFLLQANSSFSTMFIDSYWSFQKYVKNI